MTKLKLAFAALLTTGLVLEQHALTRLRQQNQILQARLDGFTPTIREHERLSNLLAKASSRSALPEEQYLELVKLRGVVGLGRRLQEENPKVRAENAKLRSASKVVNVSAPVESEDPRVKEFQEETESRQQHLKQWALMFILAANQDNGRCPDSWEQPRLIGSNESNR